MLCRIKMPSSSRSSSPRKVLVKLLYPEDEGRKIL
jgi:hypothetical protein